MKVQVQVHVQGVGVGVGGGGGVGRGGGASARCRCGVCVIFTHGVSCCVELVHIFMVFLYTFQFVFGGW